MNADHCAHVAEFYFREAILLDSMIRQRFSKEARQRHEGLHPTLRSLDQTIGRWFDYRAAANPQRCE